MTVAVAMLAGKADVVGVSDREDVAMLVRLSYEDGRLEVDGGVIDVWRGLLDETLIEAQ